MKNFVLEEKLLKYIERYGIKESKKIHEEILSGSNVSKNPTQMERFQARFEKFKKISEKKEIEPGE